MNYLKNPFILYGVIALLLLGNIGEGIYIFTKKENCPICEQEESIATLEPVIEEENENHESIFVDIKGYVKNPGVYELKSGAIVNDLIKVAGGLKAGGTTDNINLSKKLVDEATVVVLSKAELKKLNACETTTTTSSANSNNGVNNFATIESTTDSSNASNTQSDNTTFQGKISLNTATKEELMTLSGVGEKTAEKIIEYRNTQKFNTIEDIKNVSGIGDAVFEKIKDNITV